MATSKEKVALGLAETATDDEVFNRIQELVNASKPIAGVSGVAKIALLSLVPGKERPRGGHFIPPPSDDPTAPGRATKPLVLDKATLTEQQLAEITSDPYVMFLDLETDLTPEHEIKRFES